DAWDKLVDAAEACDPAASSLSCAVGLTDDVYLQWALLGDPVHALELARVAREEAGPRIVAKVRLYDVAHDAHAPDPELGMERKLKVYDMDLDGRAEVLLIVPLALPCESELDQEEGALGLVFDLEALHLQFATTRAYHFLFQDVSSSETLAQSRFRAVKGVGGHPDLEVRETVLKRYEGGEDEDSDGGSSRERSARETTCVYDVPGDRWACPEPLGAQLIEVVDGELSFGRQDP
ncbi:MAG: hypothetical protein KC636_23380, partial [Myxococcales bacterium]|nr:hypothetical protein [Myxococcales bacterium]